MAAGPIPEVQELAAAEAAFQKATMTRRWRNTKQSLRESAFLHRAPVCGRRACYRKGNLDAAVKWFQAAIALGPDIETAHRCWGDALAKSEKGDEALGHYIDAFVADPYGRTARRLRWTSAPASRW